MVCLSPALIRIATALSRGVALVPVQGLDDSATNDNALNRCCSELGALTLALNTCIEAVSANNHSGSYDLIDLGDLAGDGTPQLVPQSGGGFPSGLWELLPLDTQIMVVSNVVTTNGTGGPLAVVYDHVVGSPPDITSPSVANYTATLAAGATSELYLSSTLVKNTASTLRVQCAMGTVDGVPVTVTSPGSGTDIPRSSPNSGTFDVSVLFAGATGTSVSGTLKQMSVAQHQQLAITP